MGVRCGATSEMVEHQRKHVHECGRPAGHPGVHECARGLRGNRGTGKPCRLQWLGPDEASALADDKLAVNP
jgi:hypothetical protein